MGFWILVWLCWFVMMVFVFVVVGMGVDLM